MVRKIFRGICCLSAVIVVSSCATTDAASLARIQRVAIASVVLVGDEDLLKTPGVGNVVLEQALPLIQRELQQAGYTVVSASNVKEWPSESNEAPAKGGAATMADLEKALGMAFMEGGGDLGMPIIDVRNRLRDKGELMNAPNSAAIVQYALNDSSARDSFAREFAEEVQRLSVDAVVLITLETRMWPIGWSPVREGYNFSVRRGTTYAVGDRAMCTLRLNSALTMVDASGRVVAYTGDISLDDLAPNAGGIPGYAFSNNTATRDVPGAVTPIRDNLIRLLPQAIRNSVSAVKKPTS